MMIYDYGGLVLIFLKNKRRGRLKNNIAIPLCINLNEAMAQVL